MRKARTAKRKRKGGFAYRMLSLLDGSKVKTFCCRTKDSEAGVTDSNKGYDCKPSLTGQCVASPGSLGLDIHSYKFRCFNTDNLRNREVIKEGGVENCKYVSSLAGKFGNTVANVASNFNPYGRGGKTRNKNTNKRHTRKRK